MTIADSTLQDDVVSNTTTFATMMAVAILLLLRAVTTGLLCDELLFVHAIDLGFWNSLCAPGSSHPPLMRLITGMFADASSPDWLLRLPSILFSVTTVFVWSRILPYLLPDRTSQTLLLVAVALNPIWIGLGFQCLPYGALTFFASLHCLAWFQIDRKPKRGTIALFVVSGIAMPWTHFLGINVLLADVLIWILLLVKRRVTIGWAVRINSMIAGCTLAVVPLALFYMRHDRPFPLIQIPDFASYFQHTSALIFSHLTFSAFMTTVPLQSVLYMGCVVIIWQYLRSNSEQAQKTSGIVAVGIMLSGFGAAQLHSLISQSAMWPRYMIAGAWIHLPLIAMLLFHWFGTIPTRIFSGAMLCCAAIGLSNSPQQPGADYAVIASHLKERWQPADAFLAQSMDLWSRENHFDQLWFRRYVSPKYPVVTGPQRFRWQLKRDGLPLSTLDARVRRLWVYSHLFPKDWLSELRPNGWQLQDMYETAGPFPVALFVRTENHDFRAEGQAAGLVAANPPRQDERTR